MQKDKSQTHQQILNAAFEEFSAHGFEGASIRDIAKKAGVTSAALYRHCTDKEDLFCQLVETDLKKFRDWRKNHISTKYGQLEKNAGITELLQGNNTDMIREVIYPQPRNFPPAANKGPWHPV